MCINTHRANRTDSTQTTRADGPVSAYQGPWAARSSVVGRWAGGRAATLLLATLWPLRSALGPRQEATYSSSLQNRRAAARHRPRRAGREAPCHTAWRSRGWLGTSLHARKARRGPDRRHRSVREALREGHGKAARDRRMGIAWVQGTGIRKVGHEAAQRTQKMLDNPARAGQLDGLAGRDPTSRV